jgi:hypothetical protein
MRRGVGSRGCGGKSRHQGGDWWAPGEGIVCALIRAVWTGLRGLMENPDVLSCDGGFLRSFREQMRGYHDLLRQKPSSMFVLLGWSSISVASLMVRSIYLGLMERLAVWCSWILCYAMADLSGCLDGYVAGGPSIWCHSNGPSAQCRPDRTHRRCFSTPSVFSSRMSLTDRRKLDIFLGGKPTNLILCRDSTLLLPLNIDLTHKAGKRLNLAFLACSNPYEVGWELCESAARLAVPLENVPRNTKSVWKLSWSHRALTLCTRTSVESRTCLLDRWWWLLEFT